MGHKMVHSVAGHSRDIFGRAQVIVRDKDTGVLCAGSDGRADGCALGY
jgi:gamma-glutamyltranspeptidase/glutathione hydrolase